MFNDMQMGQNAYGNFLQQTSPPLMTNQQPMQHMQQQQFQQPMQQQAPQQPIQPVAQQGGELLQVNGIEGAKAFMTSPNSVVALFDGNGGKFYLKISNSANFSEIKTYEYKELTDDTQATPTQNPVEYVSKKEFEETVADFEEKIKKLSPQNNQNGKK